MNRTEIETCLSCRCKTCKGCKTPGGVHRTPGAPTRYSHEQMRRWFQMGMTTADIAKETGVSLSTTRRWYAKFQEENKQK